MKPEIQLYIAMSIDGYIAKENDSLDWLHELPNPNDEDYGYHQFLKDVDVVVMGRTTYEQILSFDVPWPYSDCQCFVFTRASDYKVETANTQVLNELSAQNLELLKTSATKNIWVVGGGVLQSAFLDQQAIDRMYICVIPVVLGRGKALFGAVAKDTHFKLVGSTSYDNGAVMLHYAR